MKKRHLISYVLFILGVILLLALGLAKGQWGSGALLAVAFALAGLIFYRRGK